MATPMATRRIIDVRCRCTIASIVGSSVRERVTIDARSSSY